MEQQQLQTSAPAVPVKLTPEQEEEIKLKIKYPNPQKPGGSAFIQKMLHKGNKKYFDSGDYNMAKSKNKALINNLNNNINNTNLATIQQQTPNININENTNNDQNHLSNTDATLSPATNDFNSSNPVIIDSRTTTPSSTSISNLNAVNETIISTNLNSLNSQSPSLNSSNQHQQHQQNLLNAQTTPLAASPMLSNSISTSMLSNPNYLNANQMSSSVSTASIQMLSSSISTEKLSNIQINTNPTNLLDCEEIGVGIPTPECLPQSRKHSIVQSKLATPRLSTS